MSSVRRQVAWRPRIGRGPARTVLGRLKGDQIKFGGFGTHHLYESIPTSQRPHFTGDGHIKPILNEVKDQVLLGLWTGRVCIDTYDSRVLVRVLKGMVSPFPPQSYIICCFLNLFEPVPHFTTASVGFVGA